MNKQFFTVSCHFNLSAWTIQYCKDSKAPRILICSLWLAAVNILPLTAGEVLDRQGYRSVPGELYHVLAGVSWYEGEGGSYLFSRLDGVRGTREWFVDFLGNVEAENYEWPGNCHVPMYTPGPGSRDNLMERGWLREHNALLDYRESNPVSGIDIEVVDDLCTGNLEEAALLVMGLNHLFRAPMMQAGDIIWSYENDYDPQNQTLSFSVRLVTPYGIPAAWNFEYSRHPLTGQIDRLFFSASRVDLFGYEDIPDQALNVMGLVEALAENFNNLFLYRLFNDLKIYHTEKFSSYILLYSDGQLRFESGERGGRYGYSIDLVRPGRES